VTLHVELKDNVGIREFAIDQILQELQKHWAVKKVVCPERGT